MDINLMDMMPLRLRKHDGKSQQAGNLQEKVHVMPMSIFLSMMFKKKSSDILITIFISIAFVFGFFSNNEMGSVVKERTEQRNSKTIARSGNMFNLDKRLVSRKCQDGTNHTCKCTFNENKKKLWYESHESRIKEIHAEINSKDLLNDLDIVFLGDSITESFSGRWIIFQRDLKDISEVFNAYFRKKLSGRYLNGLPIGIAGDRTADLLWRIRNGEMPNELNPKIFWILIGTNDIGRERNCSEETTIQGILRIVQEINDHKPNATIVVNSIFPRSTGSEKGMLGRHWTMIQKINMEVSNVLNNIENMYFFNASDIFLNKSIDTGNWYVPKSLMPDFLHPSKEGYVLWSEAIVKWVYEKNIISNIDAVLEKN